MKEAELRQRCKAAIAELERKAKEQPLCNHGRGARCAYESSAYILQCAIDKRHKT